MSTPHNHWQRLADNWHLVGPPLRPDAADQRAFNALIRQWTDSQQLHTTPEALILGVTPELYRLDWPAGTTLKALDASPAMITTVWPGHPDRAFAGSWTAAPFADSSQDIIMLDGGFGVLAWPYTQLQLLQEVARLLKPGGIFAVRLFAPAGRTGTLPEVARDLASGGIASLDALKLRLWGALQTSLETGVRPADVVAHIDALADAPGWETGEPGWHPAHLDTLALHRHSKATYHLINEVELQDLAKQASGLELQSMTWPDNRYGFCCPVVCLQKHRGLQ